MSSEVIQVQVKTRSSKQEVIFQDDGFCLVRLFSLPNKGKANKELIELLSEHYKVPKSNIEIIKGFKSRRKKVKITHHG